MVTTYTSLIGPLVAVCLPFVSPWIARGSLLGQQVFVVLSQRRQSHVKVIVGHFNFDGRQDKVVVGWVDRALGHLENS